MWRSHCYCSSAIQSRPPVCDLLDCSMPGFPVFHYLLESAQTQVRWFSGAIQPSHPLSPSFPPALGLSQHKGLFQWINWFFTSDGQSIGASTSVLPKNIQGWFPFRLDWFDLLNVQGSQESSPGPQCESINSSVLNLLYGPTLRSTHDYWKSHSF